MTLVAAQPVLGHQPGDTVDPGTKMAAFLKQEGYVKDSAASGDTGPTRTYALADSPQTAGFEESGSEVSDEVFTITEGGSGLTSYVLHLAGVDSASIAAAATAAQVKAAIEAMSNVGAGNTTVTGSNGGPYTVTFAAALADTNIAPFTATPTGGTGTVTIANVTQGGSDSHADE